MTVAQLIEELQKLPQDLPVVVSGYEVGTEPLESPGAMIDKTESGVITGAVYIGN
jgi:hypothetical protein